MAGLTIRRWWRNAAGPGRLPAVPGTVLLAGLPALALILALAGGARAAEGAERGVLRVAYAQLPPFTYTDSEGTPRGSVIETTREVLRRAGYEARFHTGLGFELFRALAEGRTDLWLGIATPDEFKETTEIGQSVIARIELRAYALGRPPAVRQPEDLIDRSVIVLSGYSYGGWRKVLDDPANRVRRIEARNAEQALALLRAGEAPVLLQYSQPMMLALAGRSLPNLASTALSSFDCHFVVSRRLPDAAAVLERLEAAYSALRAEGLTQ